MSFVVVVSCAAQDVVSLGVNPETGLDEIRVNLAGQPTDAKPLDMVLIPAGTFTMGCPTGERGRWNSSDWIPHEVTITQPFYLGKYEVTQAQWEVVMLGIGLSLASGCGVGDDYPMYNVSWDNCQMFIDRLNDLGQDTFRLPTDAEWEYACRAGTTTRFSFGDALECADTGEVYCELADQYMWWGGNNPDRSPEETTVPSLWGTKEVGSRLPNPWGLFDMHGNVRELCSDWYQPPSDRGPQTDPQGPTSGSRRVGRGGGWLSDARLCRSAYRFFSEPEFHSHDTGFRLLMLHVESAINEWTAHE